MSPAGKEKEAIMLEAVELVSEVPPKPSIQLEHEWIEAVDRGLMSTIDYHDLRNNSPVVNCSSFRVEKREKNSGSKDL